MSDTSTVEEALSSFGKRELGEVKVLMIEDDIFLSELVLEKLSLDGCIPYSTPNGEEGLELALQYVPDVIILDLMLPGISGEEVLHRLKSDDVLRKIPVIVFSNKSDQKGIEENLRNGAVAYLVKSSTDLSEISKVIKRVIPQR